MRMAIVAAATVLIAVVPTLASAEEPARDELALWVRQALGARLDAGETVRFSVSMGTARTKALVVSCDDEGLTARISGSDLRLSWDRMAPKDLRSLGLLVLPPHGATHLLLARFCLEASLEDEAVAHFEKLPDFGWKMPADGTALVGRRADARKALQAKRAEAAAAARAKKQPAEEMTPGGRPMKIFAHHMGCYPVACFATAHHRAVDAHKVRHDGAGRYDKIGDRWRNWDLVPPGTRLSREESAALEIRRAMRGGIDGLAIDAWAGGGNCKKVFSDLVRAAETHDYPFAVTICMDANCLPKAEGLPYQNFIEGIRYVTDNHGDSSKLAYRDEKILIFGYQSLWPGVANACHEFGKLDEWQGKPDLWKAKKLRATPEGWKHTVDAYKGIGRELGREFYFHFGMGAFNHGVHQYLWDDTIIEAAGYLAQHFGAVGEFLGRGPKYDKMAEAVRAGGAEWSQPLWYQYQNLHTGHHQVGKGTDILRQTWQQARDNGSTLLQFVTWSDYTENTSLSPGYNTRYTILDLNAYFVKWWKTGKPPAPDHDRIYLIYRKYPKGAKIFPFKETQYHDGVLEVFTILPKPGTIRLPGRDVEYRAPAGLHIEQFEVTPGAVVAELVRNGKVDVRLESPEPITDKPFREDNGMVCFSTEFMRHWKLDFPNAKPFYSSEYGDVDGDGLPNWFEMYWFGKFLDWSTAGCADPKADPDEDGRTNLEEYTDQTDPTKP